MEKGPVRHRLTAYLASIRGQPCLICGAPGEAHHLTYAQPRAMGMKTGDQHTVPVCHAHHMQLHESAMPERTFWALHGIDPVKWAVDNFRRWKRDD